MSFCPACQSDYPDDWNRCPKDGAVLLSSNRVGKFQIQTLIGSGGMGSVYRAENPDTRASVAVKLLHPSAASSADIRERFKREAEAVAALRTRHVVRIFDFGTDGETLFLVMELLHGHPLRSEILAPPSNMSLARIDLALDGSLRGLGAAHRAGVTHRDLKPENIFIADSDDGEVAKVLDFGIARTEDTNLTKTGDIMGTPAYMAPEQIRANAGVVGPHTDCYAMAVMLYEMLVGASPFMADSVSAVLARVMAREFQPIEQLRPDLPQSVIDVVNRGLAHDPAARFSNADHMRELWRAAYKSVGNTARGMRIAVAPTEPPPQASFAQTDLAGEHHLRPAQTVGPAPAKRSGALIAVLAAIGLAAGGVGIYAATRGGPEVAAASADAAPAIAPAKASMDAGAPGRGRDRRAVAPPAVPAPAPAPDGMVRIEGGDATVGGAFYPAISAALPRTAVSVAPFYIDKLEAAGNDGLPLASIAYGRAVAHCKKAGKRLPTEIEWELAAASAPLDAKRARLYRGTDSGPARVGTQPGDIMPSGLADFLGNVSEWTSSPWTQHSGDDGERKTTDRKLRAVRGASFAVSAGDDSNASIHARVGLPTSTVDAELGFRCAKDAPPAAEKETP